MASDLWHYVKDGKSQDPVSWSVLVQLARAGKIGPDDQIWNESLPRWVPASAVEGLIPARRPDWNGPPAGGHSAQAPSRGGSWVGILSLSMGLFFCFAEMALVFTAGVIETRSPGAFEKETGEAIIVCLLVLAGGAGAFVGAIIGIVALFMENSNKVVAGFGVAFNGLCVGGIILLMVVGLLFGG